MPRSLCLLAAALIFSLPVIATPSWGTGGCFVAGQAPVGAAYRWATNPATPGQINLYDGNTQIGAWDPVTRHYRVYDAATDTWGAPMASTPIAPPGAAFAPWQIGGVVSAKMDGTHEAHSISGQAIPRTAAFAELSRNTVLADDSGKMFLIPLTKDPAERKAFVDAYQADPKLAGLRERTTLWAGPASDPDHFLMRDRQGKSLYAYHGGFTLCLVDSAGDVLFRQDGFPRDGEMGELLGKLRQADPKYEPEPPSKKNAGTMSDLPPVVWAFLIIGALALLAYVHNKSQEESA